MRKKNIYVYADWIGLSEPTLMGVLHVVSSHGKEIFSFEYEAQWLNNHAAHTIDPALQLFHGAQYPSSDQENFGVLLDSMPDRWGRFLMHRREAQRARDENRLEKKLLASDYLLGVYDKYRMGACVEQDLEQLWRRIVFNICVSNVDDHLRNHGFIFDPDNGWLLSPAYDMNAVAYGDGLKLNISESDNAQDLTLAKSVADVFRISSSRAKMIISEVTQLVKYWRFEAKKLNISQTEQNKMGASRLLRRQLIDFVDFSKKYLYIFSQ